MTHTSVPHMQVHGLPMNLVASHTAVCIYSMCLSVEMLMSWADSSSQKARFSLDSMPDHNTHDREFPISEDFANLGVLCGYNVHVCVI